ncbi:MAG: tetratricopeptide repeat protein [Gemmataceae bacterium]
MLDLQAEQHNRGQSCPDLYEAVLQLKRRHDLHPCSVRPRDGLTLRRDSEREVVQDLVKRFRELPVEQRRRLPALLNSLAQLEIVVGDLESSQHDFQEVARLVGDPIARAEAHHNVYRAALERRDWSEALAALRRAVALDSETFEPFPFSRYEPESILGAGGFGVSFLCRERANGRRVVVKALRSDSLDRDVAALSHDIKLLQDLGHPVLTRIHECSCAGGEEARAYLAMEYVEGQTLAEHVSQHGPFAPDDWLAIAWPLARALQAIHGRAILHRCLRPAAVLLFRPLAGQAFQPDISESQAGKPDLQSGWRVKLLDTGLSLKRTLIHACASNPDACARTTLGRSVARTIAFAPIEVLGKPKGQAWIGPHSDIYSFGKVCAFALTGRADPPLHSPLGTGGGDMVLPETWRQLLADCTAWTFGSRPEDFDLVLNRLSQLPDADERIRRLDSDLHEITIAEHTASLAVQPDQVSALVNRGKAYARQGALDKANADYTRAIQLQPNNADLYRRRALLHVRQRDLDAAIADYTESLRLEPRNVETHTNRGLVYAQKNDYDRSLADHNEALRLNPRDPELFFNRGNTHLFKGDRVRALADYNEAARLDPDNPWAHGTCGKLHALLGDYARAVAEFTRALQLNADNLFALIDRAAAYSAMKQHEQAIADYSAALELEPNAALHNERGLEHVALGALGAAVADFTEAIALDPDFASSFLLRGNAHADMGDFDKALADFAESIRLDPDSAPGYFHRGNLHCRRGSLDEALADYNRALERNPDHAATYFRRGNIHGQLGQWDAALADYSAALRLAPEDTAALTNRGNIYSNLGDHQRALDDYSAALHIAPAEVLTLCNRANTYARLGERDRALADYTEALRYDPANARALNSRGNVHAERGDFEAALADYTQAIKIDPAFARPYHNRGNLHGEHGRHGEAIADFTEAIRLEPSYAPAYYNRGNAHAERGELDQAIADFTEALRLHPNHAGALNNRGNAHRHKDEIDAALADFTAAIAAAPDFSLPLYNRANTLADRGEYAAALADYNAALRLEPKDVVLHHNRARTHSLLGNHEQAIADNLEALRLEPDNPATCNNLAWLWATNPQLEQRDPARAIEFARRACDLAQWRNAGFLDTLAVAYAAAGQFAEAVEHERRALELASAGEKAEYQARLELYEAGKPFEITPQSPRADQM